MSSVRQNSKKLRIAFFLERFPSVSQTFILNQIVYLKDQGHTIDIYANSVEDGPVHSNVLRYNLLNKAKYPYQKINRKERVRDFVKAILNVRQNSSLLKSFNVFKYGRSALSLKNYFRYLPYVDAPEYDIIHAHFGQRGNDVINLKQFGYFKKTPLVTTFHGYDINPLKIESYKTVYKNLFAGCSLITANSLFTFNLLTAAGCPASKIMKLPVSLDTTYFQKKPTQKDPATINILFCGRLIDFKAPDLFLEIARRLVHERKLDKLRFHLIGSGPLLDSLIASAQDYQLTDCVTFHGSLTQDEIIQTMSAMDIFLYPGIVDQVSGRAENQGLVLQEAQALELPVVTSNVGGIPEGVQDGDTGFVVQEKDLDAFTDKTELLIRDQALRNQMAKKARAYVVKNFDNRVLGEQLEEAYYRLLAQSFDKN